jgi:Homeodomain-like domain
MRDAFRTGDAVQSASSTRRDLLLESLALRHQLGVLARSSRRFRPSDHLLWLLLRWWWPRWREALVLVQPATVDRWHRAGLRRYWRRRSRRPGRPRIDSTCRDLIRRLAEENHLWGAPRIHGELLKLGIAVSERTVSRYLQGRPTARSQSWRTFFANHLGDGAFMPPVMSPSAPGSDVVDASDLSCWPVRSFIDDLSAANQSALVDWPGPHRFTCFGWRLVQDHVRDPTSARNQTCRAPPAAPASGPDGVRPGGLRPCLLRA